MRIVEKALELVDALRSINEGVVWGPNGFVEIVESAFSGTVSVLAGSLVANPTVVRLLYLSGLGKVRLDWQLDINVPNPSNAALMVFVLQYRQAGATSAWTQIGANAAWQQNTLTGRRFHVSGFGVMTMERDVEYDVRLIAYHSAANGSTTTLTGPHLAAMGNIAQRKV